MAPGRNRRVLLYGNPLLRQKAAKVSAVTDELRQLIADLKTTMLQQDGLGLAANQIGVPVALICVNPRAVDVDQDTISIINPEVVETEGLIEDEEGCLSLPDIYEVIARPARAKITGLDETGRPVTLSATGLLARALVHETDHTKGILFIDYLSPSRRQLLAGRLEELAHREKLSCG